MSIHTQLARFTIETFLTEGRVPELSEAITKLSLPETLLQTKAGVFVTLRSEHDLRGCIGTIEAQSESIADEIRRNAIAAAFEDPRFPPLRKDELEEVTISVDVLSASEKTTVNQLDPKRYGVIVEHGYRRGLLLPHIDGVDSVQEQVSIALQKAGIKDSEPYLLYRFEVTRYD